jgi:hypothetical protein
MPHTYRADYGRTLGETSLGLENRCLNPSFETSTTYWTTTNANLTRVAATAQAGTRVGRIEATSTATTSSAYFEQAAAEAGKTYTVAVYFRNVTGVTRSHAVRIDWLAVGGGVISFTEEFSNVTAGGSWQRIVVSGVAPATTVALNVRTYIQRTNGAIGNVSYIDAVSIIEGTDIGFYFDGDVWQGADPYYLEFLMWGDLAGESESYYQGWVWEPIDYVTELDIKVGRETDTQPFAASTGHVTARFPTGFAAPLEGIETGSGLRFTRDGNPDVLWQGTITDVRASWGPVWDGSVGQADTLDITGEGALGAWGRQYLPETVISSPPELIEDLLATLNTYVLPAGQWVNTHGELAYLNIKSDGKFTGYLSEFVQKAATTVAAYVRDGGGTMQIVSKYDQPLSSIEFADTGATATVMVFDTLNSDSLRENLIEAVNINRAAGADILLGDGETLNLDTYSASTAQATALGEHYLFKYATPKFDYTSISALAEAQHTMELDGLGAPFWQLPGTRMQITFRGQTSIHVIEGANLSATPESSRVTYYFTAADPNAYLILDDTIRGRLDENQLGW